MRKLFDRLYLDSQKSFYEILDKNLDKNEKMFIVTANPETFNIAEKDSDFKEMMLDPESTIVPDGIGIVKAAKMLDYNVKERIPGVEIAEELLRLGNLKKKSIFILGSKEEVLVKLREVFNSKYPDLEVLGMINGYNKDKAADFQKIIEAKPDIVLVALGIPNQEKLIYKHLKSFEKGIFVGVGGSLDVISGSKKRAPKLFVKLNLEWFYRIMCEPSRFKRFYDNNIKFIFKVRKYKGGKK